MKKLLILIVILSNSIIIKAQDEKYKPVASFGIRQGINYSTVSFSPGIKQGTTLGYQGGLVFKYQNEKLFALQLELNYMQKGWTENLKNSPNSYKRKLDYVELPLITQVVMGKKSLKYYINLGTSFGYLISEKEDFMVNDEAYKLEYYEKEIEKKFEYTGMGEVGFLYNSKIGDFQLGVRYQMSLTDLFIVSSDTFFRSSQNNVWSLGVTYFIFDNK